MNQQPFKVDTLRECPVGSYSAILGGSVAEFKVGAVMYRAEFTKGVRGFGFDDTITVSDNGTLYSSRLGVYAIGLKRAIWTDIEGVK